MKKIISMITLFTISIATANTTKTSQESNEIFSIAERSEVILAIDDICGDSWCEGDYNFKFTKLACDKINKSCELSFHFIKTNEQSAEIYSPVQICRFENIRNFNQLKDSKYSLNEKFYDELTECIGIRQDELHF